MKQKLLITIFTLSTMCNIQAQQLLVYHNIVTDSSGNMQPWYNANRGTSYDHCLNLVWNFWDNIPTCCGGYKYYMMDHSYSAQSSGNKVGGDQFAMALSSWALYYQYTGDTALIDNMRYIADTYLAHSLSGVFDAWPSLPYPCNYGDPTAPIYDGDFLLGANVTQPDKAGSFGAELLTLYKITGNSFYLQTAINIANTLAAKVQAGSAAVSPYPFKVNAVTGALPSLPAEWHYAGNVVPTMRLFENLSSMQMGNTVQYDTAYSVIKRWVQQYPLQNNNWGSFFEDIPIPSNTETNAITMATYIMEKGNNWGNNWQQDAEGIMNWTLATLGSHAWDTFGVTAIYEQTADMKEGSSHTSRFGAAELLYCEKTGNLAYRDSALRQLDWATYLVDFDGQCRFSPQSGSVWYTDGYGDFVRHYLHAMASYPAIAPDSSNHLLRTTSVVTHINYQPQQINYTTYDSNAIDVLRVTSKPLIVKLNGVEVNELSNLNADGYTWEAYPTGGVLKVRHDNARNVDILWNASGINETDIDAQMDVFPNPANDMVKVSLRNVVNATEIELIDVRGRLIQTMNLNVNDTHVELNISMAANGVYFVKLITLNGSVIKKLVKE